MFDFETAMAFINSFDKLGKPVSDLNRIAALLNFLDNPQDKLKFIHIAGTNGKGSVAEMCSSILMESGYKVGLFTSPYIVEYSDRIRINGQNIPKNELSKIVLYLKSKIDRLEYKSHFSQFEISMAIAFLYYVKQGCDIVVLEVGIGGLLDCTNIVKSPIVSIITSISYDHTRILGESLEEIAKHKAGIIKRGVPCVLSAKNSLEVERVVKNQTKKMQSEITIPCYNLLRVIKASVKGSSFHYKNNYYELKMAGEHQIVNALSVIEAMKYVQKAGFVVNQIAIERGLKSASVCARAEILSQQPLVILDGAHNIDGMKALGSLIKSLDYSSSVIIIGMLKDKNAKESIRQIAPYFSEFICVDGFNPNEISANELVGIISSMGKNAFAIYDIELALTEAKNMVKDDGLLVICGSLYLASMARKLYIE